MFDAGHTGFELGDVWLSAKYRLHLSAKWPARWPRLALRGAVKVPSGSTDHVVGSGKVDFGVGAVIDKHVASRLWLYLNLNLIVPSGRITPARLSMNPIFTQTIAAELALTERWSGLLQQSFYTSPMHGNETVLLDGDVVDLGLGLNFAMRPGVVFQVFAINNLSDVRGAADFSLFLATRLGG